MRDAQGISLHLAAWARDERAAQEQTLEVLEEQERAVRARDLGAVDAAVERLRLIGERGAARGRRRDQLLSDLAQAWDVPRAALTLGSVVERLGDDGAALAELRRELRQGAAQVLRASRRVAVLVSTLRRVSGEVIEMLLTDEDGTPLHGGGALVDAEV
jgi:hypothetical protein